MSKFWIYLKTNIRADLKQAHILIAIFILLPLFFSFLMGFSFSSAFVPEVSIDPIQISLQNEDVGEAGELLSEVLASEEFEEYIEIVDTDNADFNVQIQPNYSADFSDTPIIIEANENSSSSEKNILVQFITEWQQTMVNQELLNSELENVQDPEVVNNLITSLEEVSNLHVESIFDTERYHSSTALTSNQFTAVAGLMYMLLMTLAGTITLNTKNEFKGTRKRLEIVPISPKNMVLYEMGTNTIIYTIMAMIYVFIWRLIDVDTFSGNPLFYVFWILIYTLFFQALNTALKHIVPDKLSYVFYQGILMLYMIFGFLPIERMIGGAIGEFFGQNFIREIFNQPFYDYILNQEFSDNLLTAGGLLIVSVLIVSVTIYIKQRKELTTA